MKLLTLARDIARRRGRERTRMFAAEGVRTVEELLDSPVALHGVLHSPSLAVTPRGHALFDRLTALGVSLLPVSDDELSSAAGTESPQGVLAIGEQPERSFETLPPSASGIILVLDAVQDPGNVGTILRTAQAFGARATIALPGTADLWNGKVVRGAMGALFRQHAFAATIAELHDFLASQSIPVWVADARGDRLVAGMDRPAAIALAIGNEANGVSESIAASAARRVAIEAPGMESLNVAVAAGILLFALA